MLPALWTHLAMRDHTHAVAHAVPRDHGQALDHTASRADSNAKRAGKHSEAR